MKLIYTAFLLAILSSSAVFAQKTEAPIDPSYDAELAKRLGADDRGMRQYVMCFLKTGTLKITDKAKTDELMKGHFGTISRLAAAGKLIAAGPFVEGGDFRGLYLFDVKTIEEAKQLTESDPSIKEGYFKVEFIKWYGSAALMEVNGIHKKISKMNP